MTTNDVELRGEARAPSRARRWPSWLSGLVVGMVLVGIPAANLAMDSYRPLVLGRVQGMEGEASLEMASVVRHVLPYSHGSEYLFTVSLKNQGPFTIHIEAVSFGGGGFEIVELRTGPLVRRPRQIGIRFEEAPAFGPITLSKNEETLVWGKFRMAGCERWGTRGGLESVRVFFRAFGKRHEQDVPLRHMLEITGPQGSRTPTSACPLLANVGGLLQKADDVRQIFSLKPVYSLWLTNPGPTLENCTAVVNGLYTASVELVSGTRLAAWKQTDAQSTIVPASAFRTDAGAAWDPVKNPPTFLTLRCGDSTSIHSKAFELGHVKRFTALARKQGA